jgi:hypothetical protein
MAADTYAFYVRTPEEYNMKTFSGSKLQVEVYVPEDESYRGDDSWRHFSRPAKVFYLNSAVQSDNPQARYWHVFNVKKTASGSASLANIESINYLRTSDLQLHYNY